MVKVVIKNTTKRKLDHRKYGGKARPYLGMSGIGEPCLRKRWYGFHWASKSKKFSARTNRIFGIGHLFEQLIISELKLNGMDVFRVDDAGDRIELFGFPSEKQEELIGFAAHAMGHTDGRISGVIEAPKTVHLLELKTMAQKYFLTLIKKGVKVSNPAYYDQMQRYMRAMKLDRALFGAINKNDSRVYWERVKLESGYADDLVRKEQSVIMAYEPPAKHYIPGFYKCVGGFCPHNEICHEKKTPEKNCRTCDYSDLENEGRWSCSNRNFISTKVCPNGCDAYDECHDCEGDYTLPEKRQKKGCKFYKLGWSLKLS